MRSPNWLFLVLLLLLAGLQYRLWVGNGSLAQVADLTQQIADQHAENEALLQLTAADESPKLYRVGESHAGYRIVQIGADHVVLASRAGTRSLRLSHRAPPDSLEKQP